MTMKFFARTVTLITLLCAALFASGAAANAGTRVACFRVLHASPDAPAIDVYVNRTRVAASLTYTRFTDRTWCIAATVVLVRVFPPNADPDTTSPLVSAIVNFQFDRSYVIAVANYVQQLQIINLENPPVPPAGLFTLRVAHLAPGTGGVDLAKTDGTVWLTNITFGTAQSTTQPAGTYDLVVRETGTGTVLLPLGVQTFVSRERQTLYILNAGATTRAAASAAAPPFIFDRDRDR